MVSKDEIVCPYCKKGHSKYRVIGSSGLVNCFGSEFSMTCDRCGKDFYGEYVVDIRYKTRKNY